MAQYRRVAPSIYVADLGRAMRFYQDVLGFGLECVDEPPRRAVVTQASAVLHLDLDAARAGTSRTHLMVDDLGDVCRRLAAAAVVPIQLPTDQPWGLRDIAVADPDGNVFEIAEPIGKPSVA